MVRRSVYTQIPLVSNALGPHLSNNKHAKFSGSMSSKTDTLVSSLCVHLFVHAPIDLQFTTPPSFASTTRLS